MGGRIILAVVLVLGTICTCASGLPFVVLHGILDECKRDDVCRFTEFLTASSGHQGYCIEVGDGVHDSFFMKFTEQVEIVCQKVRSIPQLQYGYNIVGLSQGALIARGVIEMCDNAPRVHNFVSLAGPHAGTASVPYCGPPIICRAVNAIIKYGVYSSYVQNHLAPAAYIKIPRDLDDYYRESTFLIYANNELPGTTNATYKARFSRLHHVALIKFVRDKVVIPTDTAWFGYYAPDDDRTVLPPRETALYREDWIGLQALDRAGNVSFISLCGRHLELTRSEALNYVVPFLRNSSVDSMMASCGSIRRGSDVFRLSRLQPRSTFSS